MNIIFLYGPPGVGKLTVGKELSKLTGYKLFHNHLTVDLVDSVFDFGSKPFIELREKIWMMMFINAKKHDQNLIFTFSPEDTVTPIFIPSLVRIIENEQNKIHFVKLTCLPEELKKRILNPSREIYEKVKNTEKVDEYYKRDHLIPDDVLKRSFEIDNTMISPSDTAKSIMNHFQIK